MKKTLFSTILAIILSVSVAFGQVPTRRGGGAPADGTYITQTPNSTLTGEQALSTLSTGLMRVATTTGVITSITDSSGIAANISDETGSGALVFANSPVFPNVITLTQGTANAAYITATGYSLTGSDATSGISLSGTWNTTGTVDFISGSLTNTASNLASMWIDLATDGSRKFAVRASDGRVYLANDVTITGGVGGTFLTEAASFTDWVTSQFRIRNSGTGNGAVLFPAAQHELDVRDENNTNNGGMRFRNIIESVTASKTPSEAESAEVYVTGDTDGQTFTLVNDPTTLGMYWDFVVTQTQASNSMSIAPPTGETLRDGTTNCATFTATAIGATARIMVTGTGSGGHFTVINKNGTWTCTP